eukprot:m.62458 g.62458  ORF g.62458 m.62458 type:complete len:303 (+) comp13933_c1_seq9:1299-2207(+)
MPDCDKSMLWFFVIFAACAASLPPNMEVIDGIMVIQAEDVQFTLQNASSTITKLIEALQSQERQIQQLEETASNATKALEQAQQSIIALNSRIDSLENSTSSAEAELETEVEQLQEDFTTFEGRVTELQLDLSNVTVDLSIVEAETAGLIASQEGLDDNYNAQKLNITNNRTNNGTNFNATLLKELVTTITSDGHEEEMAQATCAGLDGATSFVFAVRRWCSDQGPACTTVCSSSLVRAQDSQTAASTWSAFNAIHVYGRFDKDPNPRNSSLASVRLSYKMHIYHGSLSAKFCGPNFCCCKA